MFPNKVNRHFEFHVSRLSRDRYQFDQALFQLSGNIVFANFHAARLFAQRMNEKRDLVTYPEQAVKAGQINAMGLLDEISHLLVETYRRQVNPDIMREALKSLDNQFGRADMDTLLLRFTEEFPPLAVYRREQAPGEWFQAETNGVPHRELALEELLMLWIANMNPAFSPFIELFDDQTLEKQTLYPRVFPALQTFFATQPGFGPSGESLFEALRAPALAAPHSLSAQLEFVRQRWGSVLGRFLYRLLGSLDLIQEEEKISFGVGGPGPAQVLEFSGLEEEAERYTTDRDWMPRLVLMAKNAYVWLDQLSRQYGRDITHLDEVPDEELDRLARFGFTGLWLIGLWERSLASKRIKQLTGNPDAVASAYSLLDYRIASDLGGEQAVDNLRQRAWQRGIRLASDMVPNHMGIDSTWVMEHPDWFLSAPYSPFPSYSFNGPNLSWNERVGIYLEDHYYDRTDAAVVFKRVDHQSGDTRYIYHGNDGTSMPWNDTAQLNYLLPEVREAVIQTILHVARQFPVIRFDAAMTLAKRHVQRLWFPEPGTGGAIASRADFGMTKQQFDALMPQEFWREVVDRAAVEAPDTLLLAEAFWMLEGYFVRSLGMHRVYNSAFMHMIRDEDNAKYRILIKNTLEFDPEILKRYVNFMNNPDERTAVEQFGKGDKYFGVCTLMITLPGLPMFGHGQIEGFAEKYGMEYRRAYWDERPDTWLVERHEREIFPLLHRRYLFAGVENYRLYDFISTDGGVNEDVFAYSNRAGGERALVVVHNKFATARGWINTSVPFMVRTGKGDEKVMQRSSLGDGLALGRSQNLYTIFRDQSSGLEYIRSNAELNERGLYLELNAYQKHVFLDFREVEDNEWSHYAHLVDYLSGQGVPSINEALRETFVQPIHARYRELVNADLVRRIIAQLKEAGSLPQQEPELLAEKRPDDGNLVAQSDQKESQNSEITSGDGKLSEPAAASGEAEERKALLDELEQKTLRLASEIKAYTQGPGDEVALAAEVRAKLERLLQLVELPTTGAYQNSSVYTDARNFLSASLAGEEWIPGAFLAWLFTYHLGMLVSDNDFDAQSRSWMDEWLLRKIIAAMLRELGADEAAASRGVLLVKALISQQRGLQVEAQAPKPAYRVIEAWLKDDDVRSFLQVNRYQDVLWYNKEAFEQLLDLMLLAAMVEDTGQPGQPLAGENKALSATVRALRQAQVKSDYRVEKLLATAAGETVPPGTPS
ncbi:MAG TPA: alpha-amylase family glycosyl hydrolase [Chloroflexia bacterium]|nr:alpha-amylase family glycosyl hydrolase [Chloroflexia bacterium]